MNFADAFSRGLGRTVLMLQEYGCSPQQRTTILYGIRNNFNFDPQIEDPRSPYLWDILTATGERDSFIEPVVAMLTDPNACLYQVAYLCSRWIEDGHTGLREPLYACWKREREKGFWTLDDEMIRLDGLAAYFELVGHHDQNPISDDDLWHHESLQEDLETQLGKRALRRRLRTLAVESPYLQRVWESRVVTRREQRAWRHTRHQRVQYTEDDYLRAAHAVVEETDPKRLVELLRKFFRRHPFPLEPSVLIGLASHPENRVAHCALTALSNNSHPDIRAFALAVFEHRAGIHSRTLTSVPRLLAKNAGAGDTDRLLELWTCAEDDEQIHRLTLGIDDFATSNPDAPLIPLLLRVYEEGVCQTCRYRVLKVLIKRDAVTDEIWEELRWDCYDEIRALAEKRDRPDR